MLWETAPSGAHLITMPECSGAAQTLQAHAPEDIHVMPHHPCTVSLPRQRRVVTCHEHLIVRMGMLTAGAGCSMISKMIDVRVLETLYGDYSEYRHDHQGDLQC